VFDLYYYYVQYIYFNNLFFLTVILDFSWVKLPVWTNPEDLLLWTSLESWKIKYKLYKGKFSEYWNSSFSVKHIGFMSLLKK
jgi:hypothetical protein